MVIKSYSKINLTLKVGPKKRNGLHEIQSFFCLIDLVDKIQIKKIKDKKDKIIFTGLFAKLVNKSNNSILNLLKTLRGLKLISNYYSIKVKKNIPVFAGLGGGTSNAFTVMNYVLREKLSKKNLNIIEKKIVNAIK